MRKYILLVVVFFIGISVYAQDANVRVKHEQVDDLVQATYFYADGSIQQIGTFNEEGKLHGVWKSFDTKGNRIAVGKYENGKKVGKWTFWNNGVVKEVNFVNSKITSVTNANENKSL